jgi:hypothetical protein
MTIFQFVRRISVYEWFTRASEPLKKNAAQVPTEEYSGEDFKEQHEVVLKAGFGY